MEFKMNKRKHARNRHLSKVEKQRFKAAVKFQKWLPNFLLLALWTVRVFSVLCPQYGYIQPDEFFQSTEPIAGDVFHIHHYRVWEFDSNFPLRSMFFPQLFSLPPFSLIKLLHSPVISSYLLLIGPRLLVTLASFLIDYSIYTISMLHIPKSAAKSDPLPEPTLNCLLVHSSTYLAFTYYTHTFTNCIETILLAILLAVVFKSTLGSRKFPYCTPTNLIGIILSLGFFNRPTFALFACVPTLYWILNYCQSKNDPGLCWRAIQNSAALLSPFSLMSMVLVLLDTHYHRGICFPELSGQLNTDVWNHIVRPLTDHLVLTPANFLIYNLQTTNLSNHGLHPFYFHLLVNMPLMFTLLTVILFVDLFRLLFRLESIELSGKPSDSSTVMRFTVVLALAGFSAIPHQEARFLLPLVVPLVSLYANHLVSLCTKRHLISLLALITWILVNTSLVYFYGYVHQAGTIKSLFHLNHIAAEANQSRENVDLIFSRQYLPPRHLLNIPQEEKLIEIHDLSIESFHPNLFETLESISRKSSSVYLSIPRCYEHQLRQLNTTSALSFSLQLVENFFPHFSAEDLDVCIGFVRNRTHSTSLLTTIYHAFSMSLWKIHYMENL